MITTRCRVRASLTPSPACHRADTPRHMTMPEPCANPLAIHSDEPTSGSSRLSTSGRPGANGAVQLVTVQALQGTAHGRLRWRAPGPKSGKNLLRRIGSPLTDGGE